MKVRNPYTGHCVNAPEGVAERLLASGFVPVEEEKPKGQATRRRTTKKPQAKE